MNYYKYHGLGNDYIVLDPANFTMPLTPARIRLICHRNFGIGSDGILYGPIFENDTMLLKIYNPDGSEAEKSGNGLRIFSRYLIDREYVRDTMFTVKTAGGTVTVEVLKNGLFRIEMGRATFASREIPVAGTEREVINESIEINGREYRMTCVSVGNPHCVIPVARASGEEARDIGPLVENHPLFPNRVNMQLLEVMDRSTIKIEIWERGAGYTLASGSSSSAAACAARKLGLVDGRVTVIMPGGQLEIAVSDDYSIVMTGPVSAVSSGVFAADLTGELQQCD
jgi:diaminopimelate epimerase